MLHLILVLAIKNLKERYYRRHLRAAWILLNPLLHLLIFTLIFSRIAGFDSEGVPYPLFNFCALISWIFLSSCLTSSCHSLTSNRNLITRLKFPRAAIAVSSLVVPCIDFVVSSMLFLILMGFYKIPLSPLVIHLLPVLAVQLILAAGVSLIFSIGNAYLRDISNALPFFSQTWLLLSPVVYSPRIIPGELKALYFLNPMAFIIDSYRRVLLHGQAPDAHRFFVSLTVSVFILALGLLLFKKLERNLADVI